MTTYTQDELNKATNYCALSEHCLADVHAKLAAWQIDEEAWPAMAEFLLKNDFVNEQRYCRAFVNDKFRYAKWGKIKIAMALRAKHLPEAEINAAVANIDDDEYANTLQNLLKAKLKGLKYKDQYDKQSKLYRFALSRGFESAAIGRVIRGLDA